MLYMSLCYENSAYVCIFLSSQMWSYCPWTAQRPAAGWIISCELMRSSGKRTTAPSASVWMGSRIAQPWPANRAAKTLSRSLGSAVPSVKVFYIYHSECMISFEIYISMRYTLAHIPHVGGSCVAAALLQRPCRHGLIKEEAREHSSSCRVLCVPLLLLPAKMRPTCVYEAVPCF